MGAADTALVSGTFAAQLADSGYEDRHVSGKRRHSLADGLRLSAGSPADQTSGADGTFVAGVFCAGLQCTTENLVERARPFDKIPGLQFLIRKPHDFSFPPVTLPVLCRGDRVFATLPLWFG
ncbi:MAG: hypothetical protein ACLR5S_07695 [Ruminococcus sp.]